MATMAPGSAPQREPDERRGGEERSGGELAHRDGVEQLALGEPVALVDQRGLEERVEHVPAAVEHGPDLEEDPEQWGEHHRTGRGQHRTERPELVQDGDHEHPREPVGGGGAAGAEVPARPGHQPGDEEDRELVHAGDHRTEREQRDRDRGAAAQRRSSELEDRLDDEHDDHRRDPGEHRLEPRPGAVLLVEPGQPQHHEERREDERDPGEDQPLGARPHPPDVHRDLGRVGTGHEVGEADELRVLGVVDPALALDEVVTHQRDVRGRAAERGGAEAQEVGGDLAQRARARSAPSGSSRSPRVTTRPRRRLHRVFRSTRRYRGGR